MPGGGCCLPGADLPITIHVSPPPTRAAVSPRIGYRGRGARTRHTTTRIRSQSTMSAEHGGSIETILNDRRCFPPPPAPSLAPHTATLHPHPLALHPPTPP